MPRFAYVAVDANGQRRSGTLTASNQRELEERLRQEGLWLVSSRLQAHREERVTTRRRLRLRGGRRRKELINFCTVMTFMLEAGIPMVEAIGYAASDCENRVFQRALLGVREGLESGYSLYEAMSQYPGVFPQAMVYLVRAGEASGKLPETLTDLRRYFEWIDQTLADIRQATAYPVIVLALVLCLVMFLFTIVVPKFQNLLQATNATLPTLTQFIFHLGQLARKFWWLPIVLFGGFPMAFSFLSHRSPTIAYHIDQIRMKIPLFGPLFHMIACSRYAHNLGLLYRAGINILQAIELTSSLTGSPVMEKRVLLLKDAVERGETLGEAMRDDPIFPPLLVRMVAIGERSGQLDEALANVAQYYDIVIPRKLKRILSFLEPILIVTIVCIVGLVAVSIFLPLLTMMKSIR